MAKLGEIILGGRGATLRSGAQIFSAVAYELSALAPSSARYVTSADWEVELRKGQVFAVARSSLPLDLSALLSHGLEQIQRHLDLLSYEQKKSLLVKSPSEGHIALFQRNSQSVVRHFSVHSLGFDMTATGIALDAQGHVMDPPPSPPAVWHPALRFYRQSQTSRGLYEAYRLLWLGFESLLNSVCPKQKAEREIGWVTRAFTQLEKQLDLGTFVPSQKGSDPVPFLVGTLYEFARHRLFHAKGGAKRKSGPPDPQKIGDAYERLLRLSREVAQKCLSVRAGSSSGTTFAGFALMIQTALVDRVSMQFTDDRSPFSKQDVLVSPAGRPVLDFGAVEYLGETAPGRHSFLSSHALADSGESPVVFRVATVSSATLVSVATIDDGLELTGVDAFESYQTFRLVNRGLPRVIFGE